MADFVNLPWLNPGDPVDAYSHGLQLGMQAGTEQARQQLQQEQLIKQEQQQAIENAHQAAVFHMQSEQQARKFAAQQRFQSLLQQGADPAKALLQVAPDLGESLTGAAQLYRATQSPQMTPYQQQETQLRKRALDLQERKLNKPNDVFQSGPVQGQPVLDPETKQPIPGLVATPAAGGKGMTVHLTPKAQATFTPAQAAALAKGLPALDEMLGNDPKDKKSVTSTVGPDLLDIVKSALPKKDVHHVDPELSKSSMSKVDRANILAKKHPDWTKQQIIQAVNAGKDE